MTEPVFDRAAAAAMLRAKRDDIAARLSALVADWPKYAGEYAADPAAFAAQESHALVEFIAGLIETGDPNYRHLYIGEKAKQFHDVTVDPAARHAREAVLLRGEHSAFAAPFTDDPPARAAIAEAFDAIRHALTTKAAAEVKLLLVGDCLYLDVIAFLTAPALEDGVRIVPTFVTTHDAVQIRSELGKLAGERFDLVCYSPFTYALLSDYEALQRPRVLRDPRAALRHARRAVAESMAVFDVIADLFDCPIVAHAPAPILRHGGAARARIGAALTLPLRRHACSRLAAALRKAAVERNARGQAVHILDEAAVAGPGGLRAAGRYLYHSAVQHPAAFGALLAPIYRDLVMVAGRLLKRKLVACDLDNTLWAGVIGEGLGVAHHHDRQAPLLELKRRGVVLAINSKNDPAKVAWDAKDSRLTLDDFVSRQINWEAKPSNMRRIAGHLNLKEKDFVFIDDRADERAMVAEEFPAMLTLDALDPRNWRLLALWADLLPAKPGADRTDFYRQRDARQAFVAAEADAGQEARAASYAKLGLTLTIRAAAADDVARVTDLINRTNQFNMAGSRITRQRVEELVATPNTHVLIADAADRFGAMGTIAVLIVERDGDRLVIPAFVLSCRVFGYGMEFAMLEETRKLAGVEDMLFGPLVETPFNQPCRDVYRTAGFEPSEGGWRLTCAGRRAIRVEPWLTVDSRIDAAAPELPSAH